MWFSKWFEDWFSNWFDDEEEEDEEVVDAGWIEEEDLSVNGVLYRRKQDYEEDEEEVIFAVIQAFLRCH